MKKLILLFSLAILAFANNANAQIFSYDFSNGNDEWMGDFADYPVNDSVFYELEFTRKTLPIPLNTNKYALRISGNNHSDDLFMFIKRKISGLLPNTTYQLEFEVEFASQAPTNANGVGGAPGEGVTMKAGASLVEPLKINLNGFYFMNIDKSNQVSPGADMDTIGHVGVSDTTTVFTLIHRNNTSHLFNITTDANGETWVCIGTDSGFEATTTLYYNQIILTFTHLVGLDDFNPSKAISIYPNPTSESIKIKVLREIIGQVYTVIDLSGRPLLEGVFTSEISNINIKELPNGMYFLTTGVQKKQTFKILKK